MEDDEYNLQRGIRMILESFKAPVGGVVIHEPDSVITQRLPVVEGNGKGIDDTSTNVVYDTSSLGDFTNDADNVADMEHSNSEADMEIFNVEEVQARELSRLVYTPIPIIDLTPPKPVSPPVQEPIFTAATATTTTLLPPLPPPQQSTTDPDLANRVSVLENRSLGFKKKHQLQDKTTKALASRVYKLEYHDLDLSEVQMKEILHDRMFESGSYKSHLDHATLYEALEVSRKRDNNDELHEVLATSQKRPWKTSDTREAPSSSCKQKLASPSVQPVDDNPSPEDMHLSESKDTDQIDLINPKGNWVMYDISKLLPLGGPPGQVTIQTRYFFNRDLEYLVSCNKERRHALSISKLKAAYYLDFKHEELVPSLWTKSESAYDISSAYCISHWWFKRKIVLRRADYKEYKISKANFKNLHPNNSEDLYLLNLQGKLNHLSGANKVHLSTTVNLWTRNIVTRQRMEDLQLSITKMMREIEVHKFSDGTLTRILEKLDYMVKDYELFKFNPSMENRIWTDDDKRRSQEFIKLIKRRLKAYIQESRKLC
nr:hypothetical protein [Tanacetum cinerariifolium]